MVVIQAFNGAGDTFTPTMINIFCFWLFQLPLAFILAQTLEIGPSGVWNSQKQKMLIIAERLARPCRLLRSAS